MVQKLLTIMNFGNFWRFHGDLLITAALVVKLGIWEISAKIVIKSPKNAKIHFGQQIPDGLNVPLSKLPDFLKFGQILVKRFLNISTGLVGYYTPFNLSIIYLIKKLTSSTNSLPSNMVKRQF